MVLLHNYVGAAMAAQRGFASICAVCTTARGQTNNAPVSQCVVLCARLLFVSAAPLTVSIDIV